MILDNLPAVVHAVCNKPSLLPKEYAETHDIHCIVGRLSMDNISARAVMTDARTASLVISSLENYVGIIDDPAIYIDTVQGQYGNLTVLAGDRNIATTEGTATCKKLITAIMHAVSEKKYRPQTVNVYDSDILIDNTAGMTMVGSNFIMEKDVYELDTFTCNKFKDICYLGTGITSVASELFSYDMFSENGPVFMVKGRNNTIVPCHIFRYDSSKYDKVVIVPALHTWPPVFRTEHVKFNYPLTVENVIHLINMREITVYISKDMVNASSIKTMWG